MLNNAIFTILQELAVISNKELKIKFQEWLPRILAAEADFAASGLWSIVQRFLIAFPSSYLAERRFSAVVTLVTKKRNRLHVTERGDLWLFLSKIEPDINKIFKMHQIQPFH